MARKSNKTAHVLNLLAGHDAAKEADEQASAEQEASGGTSAQPASGNAASQAAQTDSGASAPQTAQPVPESTVPQAEQAASSGTAPQTVSGSPAPQTAPGIAAPQAGQAVSGQAVSVGTASVSGNAVQPTAPIPAAPVQNNIAMIDKTGDDPVAELIQQKLSSEFEKQMHQSQTETSSAENEVAAPEEAAISAETSSDNSDIILAADADDFLLTDTDSEELLVSDAESVVPEMDHASGLDISSAAGQNTTAPVLEENAAETVDAAPAADSMPNLEDEFAAVPAAEPVPENEPVPQTTAEQNAEPAMPMQEAAASRQPASDPAAVPEPSLNPDAAVSEADRNPDTAPAPQASSEPAAPAPAPAPEPEPEPEPDFAAINVMEHIVRDKIIYFMRQFDVCTCDRCKADVTALTLNGLMPKYIVTMKAAVDPLLSYYTNRLISDVTVEATKSCMIVKENPRH